MSAAKTRYYWIKAAALTCAGILSLVVGVFGAMTAGFGGGPNDYWSFLFSLHAILLMCYIPAFVLSVFSMRMGIKVQWCLVAAGIVIYLASAFRDGIVSVSILSGIIPAIGGWVLEQEPEFLDVESEGNSSGQ